MLKKNLVIAVGGVISLLIFMVVAGVLILSLTNPPATGSVPQQTETSH